MGSRTVGCIHFFTFCFPPCFCSSLFRARSPSFLSLPAPAARASSSRGRPVCTCILVRRVCPPGERERERVDRCLTSNPVSSPLRLRLDGSPVPHPDAGALCFLMGDGFRIERNVQRFSLASREILSSCFAVVIRFCLCVLSYLFYFLPRGCIWGCGLQAGRLRQSKILRGGTGGGGEHKKSCMLKRKRQAGTSPRSGASSPVSPSACWDMGCGMLAVVERWTVGALTR